MTKRQAQHLKRAFLERFRVHGNISRACRDIGMHNRTEVYRWQEHDEAFATEYRAAEIEATEVLESAAFERAVNGVTTTTPIMHRGKVVDTVVETKYSDTLLIFLLKARNPAKYRETIRNEHSGPDGGAIDFGSESLDRKLAALAARTAAASVPQESDGE